MNNLKIELILGLVTFIFFCIVVKSNDGFIMYILFFIIAYILYILSAYPDYKLIKYIQANHKKFYEQYKDRIGLKFWRKNLKKELESLNDDYINKHIKKL